MIELLEPWPSTLAGVDPKVVNAMVMWNKINAIVASVNDLSRRIERMEALMPHAPGIED